MLLMVILVAGAYIFDSYHDQMPKKDLKHHTASRNQQIDINEIYFYNPVSSFKIRTGMDKLLSKILFTIGQDKFLSTFHNQLTYHLMKEESLHLRSPLNPMVHFRKFIICHQCTPDDAPSLS